MKMEFVMMMLLMTMQHGDCAGVLNGTSTLDDCGDDDSQ